ncbi:AHH domain-containing protein [Cellvibrio sp. OA-2007]|uniref:AHH domain-containing protein n=1 Tax=Cellvibrio sp. OA-2007 TaxID=529823 RepID=UPI0007812F25|nr:AHH domain-containing protein [Cellvibrio sp. OA-2007]
MNQEFLHGASAVARYDEMSPLDRAIETYTNKAKKYYSALNRAENAPKDVREARKKELESIKKHLENERRLMETIVDVRARLEIYRETGRNTVRQVGESRIAAADRRNTLLAEEHHPTKVLEEFMRAVPMPKPSPNHTAHHIVPGKGRTVHSARARSRIHLFGIRINDPDNGVWLPSASKYTPHWSMPEALGHKQYHTEGYEKWVSMRLRNQSSEAFIRQELRIVALILEQNKLPSEARVKSK